MWIKHVLPGLLFVLVVCQAKLEFSFMMMRHGERYPIDTFGLEQKFPILNDVKPGDLTEKGRIMMHDVGVQTRETLKRLGLENM